ncbi:hypothetical protein ABE193_26760 [Bacillus mycoides]|jgi:hypothetical protein|uniref:hypothetical protein n=1 Tax=Bacillus mycoides TaxID=1405 RepID=UPI003D0520D5
MHSIAYRQAAVCFFLFIPLFAGSKTPASKFSWSKEVGMGVGLPVNARLVKANNQWGMNKTPTD